MKRKVSFIFTFIFVFVSLFAFAFKTQTVNAEVSESQLQEEVNNIVVPGKVIFDFPVVSVSAYGSIIAWESSDSAVLNVPTSGGWVAVNRPTDADANVKLTVTLKNGELTATKEFNVLVPKGVTLTNTYNINYVLNGGANPEGAVSTYKVGETPELPTPTKGELDFLGWFKDEACEGAQLTQLPKGISGDVTVYAKWEAASVTGIVVKTNPTKVVYNALESFDSTGLVVEKVFNYGENEEVALSDLTFDKTVLHHSDTKVTVSFGEFTAEVNVTVNRIDPTYTLTFEDSSAVYTGLSQTLSHTFSTEISGLTAELSSVSAVNVGSYDFTLTFANTNDDYNTPDAITKTLTITKAPLTVQAANKSVKVGAALPEYTVQYSGFVNGETEAVLNVTGLQLTCSAVQGSPAGTYTIVPSGVTADNYEITFVNGTLTITAGNYSIDVDALDLEKVYNGENQMFTAKLVEGDVEISGVEFTYTVNGEEFVGATNAGTYVVTVSYNDTTYGTGSQEFTLVISKATYDMTGVSFVNQTVTFTGALQNLVISGTLPEGVSVTYSEGITNVGSKEIVASFTGDADNYEAIASMKATITVEAKALEATMFDEIAEQAYTGSAIEPVVSGKYNNYELTEADIEVSYENNIEKGTATITVTGKGNMSGSVELTFEIGDSDLEKVAAARGELEALYGDVLTGTLAEAPATLPLVTENGCEVMWSSNSTALSVNELGEVTILATSEAQAVVLVATIESGNAFEQTTFEFTVPAKSAETTLTLNIKEIATANSWANSTKYSTLPTDDSNVLITSSGTTNTGKYYTSDYSWRFYQSENGSLTIKALNGKVIVSVQITYTGGTFKTGDKSISSNQKIEVNETEITFIASSSKPAVTNIAIIYK